MGGRDDHAAYAGLSPRIFGNLTGGEKKGPLPWKFPIYGCARKIRGYLGLWVLCEYPRGG